MSNVEVTTGDKIKGKVKEGLGSITGNKEMKEEGKAVHKVEKDAAKVEKQEAKVAKQHNKMAEHSLEGGVQDPSNVGVGEKMVGGIKEGLGNLTGDKQMKEEGKAVGKAEKDYEKLDKEGKKLEKKDDKLLEHRLKADV
jgi:uncharacterized protein YjbJ (UPF0337 family)